MRLKDFILADMAGIAAEWESFAATLLPAAKGMTRLALRNHVQQILQAIAKDIATSQTRDEQADKSKGWAREAEGAPETAAQTHAVLRAQSGFDIEQLVAEYRALRASVLRRWLDSGPLDGARVQEVIRFGEAIDQAIAESISHFHDHVEQARSLLLGMLGHDMRTPLGAISATASHLSGMDAGEDVSRAAARLLRSSASMQALLDELVDFNRTKFGLSLRISRSEAELASLVAEELDQLRDAHPDRRIELTVSGDTRGRWDGGRLQQLVRNLVSNGIQHGSPDSPIRVRLLGEPRDVCLEVENQGSTLDESAVRQIFDPLRRIITEDDPRQAPPNEVGLGLGLFIVREIARAHGGDVELRSEEGETTFAVRLPRHEAKAASGVRPRGDVRRARGAPGVSPR